MDEKEIIEYMKQGMQEARYKEMLTRQAAHAFHKVEHSNRYFILHKIWEKLNNNFSNYTLNFLKKYWTAGDNELRRQIEILVETGIIKNADTVFDIQAKAAPVELLCLLNFWNNNRFTKFNRFPFKRICRHITHNEGKEFDPDELKKMNYNYKQYEAFSKKPNERYLFFEKNLLNK